MRPGPRRDGGDSTSPRAGERGRQLFFGRAGCVSCHSGKFQSDHGGLIASLADVASGYAAYSLLGDGVSNVTVELKLNLLRPAGGARLVARGEVVKPGRTLTVCRSDVFAVSDRQEVLCATSLGTFMTLRDRPERPASAPADDRP